MMRIYPGSLVDAARDVIARPVIAFVVWLGGCIEDAMFEEDE